MEVQPALALMDPAYTNTVGWKGEFNRFWLRDNPTGTIYHFGYSVGGSRFSSAGSLGADANWLSGVSGGACENMLTEWNAFKAALAAEGKVPNVTFMMTDLGHSSATDNTEAAAYQADMTALIAWMRANIGTSTTRLVIARLPSSITGVDVNKATLRTAQGAIATADAYTDLIYMDDAQYAPGAADGVHLSAAQHMLQGERLYCRYANRWHPMDALVDGSSIVPTDIWRPGDWRNTIATGVSSIWDGVRGITSPVNVTQGTAGSQPALVTETTGDGLSIRIAAFDGGDKMICATGMTNGRSTWGMFAAMRVTTPGAGSVTPIGQGNVGDANPFMSFRVKSDGLAEFLARNNAGAVTGPGDISAGTAGGNVMRHFAYASAAGGVTGNVDGVSGSQVNYDGGSYGASTLLQTSLGVLNYGGGDLGFATCAIAEVWWTNTTPDATYLANAHEWHQWRWGTP